jgi:isopenicillin N synthase-like dioxygenase
MGDASSPTIEIPVIDISGYLDPSCRNATQTHKVVQSLRSACQSPGFFQITGHNISATLRQSLLEEIEQFFNLPLERKQALHRGKSHCLRGWESVGEQSLEAGFADQKEGFMVGLEMPGATRFLQGPNHWPEPEDGVSGFRGTFMQYFEQVRMLSRDVFRLMALSLELNETYFDWFVGRDNRTVFLLHL